MDVNVYNLLCGLAKIKQIIVVERIFPKRLYGLFMGDTIAIKSDLDEAKKTYTLAHELAHCYLHFDKGNTIESHRHSDYEEQADRAALMLLDAMKVLKIQNSINAAPEPASNVSCI